MNERTKIKILFLITDLGKGGAERYLIDLCTELKQRDDVEFIIGSLFDNNQYSNLTTNFKIVNLDFQTFSLRRKNECLSYKDLLDNFQPDIIHTHRFLAEFLSAYYVSPDIKYVCHGHDNMVQFSPLNFSTFFNKEKLTHFIEKKYLTDKKYKSAPTYFIANSQHTFAYYKKQLPKDMQSKVELISYGFEFDKFYSSIEKKNNRVLKILNVGSFQPKKNQAFIIKIAKELKNRGLEFEINLLGDGPDYTLIENLIQKNDLQAYVFLRGIIDNVEDWYKSSDIYLHTAWYEPFGLVLLEAMAAGLPIIALDGKGNKDLIKNGENGYLLTDQNPILFADTIFKLIERPELKESIAKYAQKFAANYSIENKTNELIAFYKSILENK
jgi:glycosyltransferase involved in cell wall biosynthesis